MVAIIRRTAWMARMSSLIGRLAFTGITLAGIAGLAPEPARAAEAASARIVDLTYDVYLGGLHIFTFDVNMTLQPDRYRVTAEGETQGTIGWLYSLSMKLAADGLDENGRIEPRTYATDTEWGDNQRSLRLGFGEDGRYNLQRIPTPEPDPDVDGRLPETLPAGTVDPLSLAVAASRALEETGRCDQTVPVFDGQRRYDLTVKQVDETMLPPNDYSIYQGPAVRCSFSMKRISGFRNSWKSSRQWNAGSPTPPTIWVAEIRQDLPPVPVRYEGAIALGSMVVHLTDAKSRIEPTNAAREEPTPQD